MEKILEKLGTKYGTDKVTHGFCELYGYKFDDMRTEIKNILEVGVFFGSSVLMWRDYFPEATIHGFDTFEGLQGNGHRFENADKFYKSWESNKDLQNRIELYKYDQSKENDIVTFVSEMNKKNIKFDIIIDDGSHLMSDQQLTLKYLYSLVKDGGYYVIEDVHSSVHEGYDLKPDRSNSTLLMINEYMANKELKSIYTDLSDVEKSIDTMDLFTTSVHGSMTCLIKKK